MPQYFRRYTLFSQQGLVHLRRGIRSAQTLLNYTDFKRLKQLTHTLSLGQLLSKQPRFIYKYLTYYTAASFSRKMRLAAILNHYQFLVDNTQADFFVRVAQQPVLWQHLHSRDLFSITLSYPLHVGFEGELSLNFCFNETIIQTISFVIIPGELVRSAHQHALFICQVQGSRHPALLKHATKTLHDITPAVLLINAAYGISRALGIGQAVGVSTDEQLNKAHSSFDYDGFWQQFDGRRTTANLFLLNVPAPEKPIQHIKSNHRARTLRKRHYKLLLREAVAQYFGATFLREQARTTS